MAKFRRKTRTIISGLGVGLASLIAVVYFVDLPREELNSFIVSTIIFFVGIIVLAVLAVVVIKGLGALKNLIFNSDSSKESDSQGE